MNSIGRLILIPNVIADGTQEKVIPNQTLETLKSIRFFLAEDARNARRYFSSLKIFASIETLTFYVLNKNTKTVELQQLFEPVMDGHDLGVVSESGCPGIADPGAMAVAYAHEHNVKVVPLVGPSSLLLALMASGLNGQQFTFHGYLPIDGKEAGRVIQELEKESRNRHSTQLFIETPYRNNALLKNLLLYLQPQTTLCVAMGLTSPEERIITRSVRDWKLAKEVFPKTPAIFMFMA